MFPHAGKLGFPPFLASTQRLGMRLRDASLALLYPHDCRVCGRQIESWHEGVVCAPCWEAANRAWQGREACGKCGAPLRPLAAHLSVQERDCGRCRDFAFGRARACGAYEGALLESVLWLKLHPQLAPQLRQRLREVFDQQPGLQQSDALLPVPLHSSRQAERRFNQAELIAEALAVHTGLRIDTASLIRTKPTERHRAGMGAAERAKSLRKAFRVRAPRLIAGRTLLLVDDVMTTGSTAHEIAQTLLEGGAKAVNVLTLARAVSVFV